MKKFIQGTLAILIVLLLMESFSRVLFTLSSGGRSSSDYLYQLGVEASPELGWQRISAFNGRLSREPGGIIRRFDSRGFLLTDREDILAARAGDVTATAQGVSSSHAAGATAQNTSAAGRTTILTIGDSSTFGWGVPPESSFSEILDRMLPDKRVINLGVVGYSSYQGYKSLMKHAPSLNPALIIVSFNYNDRRYVLSEADFDSDEKFSRDAAGRTLNDITNSIYTYRILNSAMRKVGVVSPPGAGRRIVRDARELEARVPPESYRENLRQFARFGKERQIPVIFLILGDNPAFTTHLRRGTELLEKSQYELATRALTIGVRLDNPFSDIAKKQLIVALEKQGNSQAAKETTPVQPQFSAAGGKPIYLDSEYHDLMRSVAKEYGIAVVEAAKALEDDPSMYVDFCHPDTRGHELIARLLYQSVKPRLEKM
jgi:lysophospholipase L1-like esterase